MTNSTNQSVAKSQRRMAREPKTAPVTPEPTSAANYSGHTAHEQPTASTEKKQTKVALVLALLSRPEGATLHQLAVATSWLPHTTRAALTGLKKKGHTIISDKVDGANRIYRVASA